MDRKRLVVIDGYSLLYRAFFATRYLSTSDGRPTNALFGFTSMLFTLLERVKPDAIVVAMDAPGKTFRHAEVETYKATRKETQDELRVQLRDARELIAALGIPTVEAVGFEADDVVGTITLQAKERGYNTTVVTGDLDALQLVDDTTEVMTPGKGMTEVMVYGCEAVIERYGFGPEHIPDFKALKGDTSDNIPGVPGIGDKGAAELIQGFGTIESLLERIEEVPPKFRKKIEGNEDQMRLSKRLATIVRDVELPYDFPPFVLSPAQMEAARAMFERFEFRQAARRAPIVLAPYLEENRERVAGGEEPETSSVSIEEDLIPVTSSRARGYGDLIKFVDDRPYAVFLGPPAPKSDGELFEPAARMGYVAVGTDVRECDEADALKLVHDLPELAILHDAKLLYRRLPAGTPTPRFDTMLAGYVLQSGRSSYNLRDLAQGYLDAHPPANSEGLAAGLYLLEQPLRERLEKEGQTQVFAEAELPLVPILAEMENFGIRVEREVLRDFSKHLEVTIAQVQEKVFALAGGPFLIGSPKQLGEVLFEKLGIPGATRTKIGYATGVEVLSTLAPTYEIAQEVLNWRELTKLKSTYADAMEKLIAEDGRLHTSYNQTVAATGRLSSSDPNLQNIPVRTELGRGLRAAFVADPGYSLLSLDYSQIELRILAHMCGEPALVNAFQNGEDVHTASARQIFALDGQPPSKEQRRLAKMLNYAVLYGVSEFGLQQQLGPGFSIAEARALIEQYNERFPSVRGFTKSVVQEAKAKSFTTTLMGRRRYFPDIQSGKIQERRSAERQAMNAPIQGTAADMMKLAMVRARRALDGSRTRMLLNVHDELVFEMPDGEEGLIPKLREAMETALPLSVPIEVDAKKGANWNEMTPVK